ncbi:MAG TPA: hypothetical protein VFA19_03530 [Gaiellaceae bacterium]|nr:hypothetical protein [Gaiellaceae bacterium]
MTPAPGVVQRVVGRLARAYIAGPALADAVRAAHRLARPVTFGYWDAPGETGASVADAYCEAIAAAAEPSLDAYLSAKLPALGDAPGAVDRVAAKAAEAGVRLHFDSLQEEHADRTLALARLLATSGVEVGASLPGGWSRSVADAAALAAAGVRVRVVKGQWPGDREPRAGFLEVVDRLARAGAPAAAVATHDAALAAASVDRLLQAGVPVELELLYGLPMAAVGAVAGERDVATRVYVSYGHGYLPYAVRQVRRRPRILWWLLRDSLRGDVGGLSARRRSPR